ncbi:hypothetical protein [Mycobacterium sherrisii]|uniref:Uncharacterized protein n=1 Tax=Mycobacterium sherrisii TaxID=243061 RepID=A0A1E3T5K8_9MYCO|nr:hypothetical protein [Mycobacterium sherrisii]MCV7030570.1 hypothetical protein [Mycobacterium sherrisii]MEC4762145.1 hypothetical protein [Mycobacterium sherrisii]ODR08988.1 hypothetical protein BHQ21_05215 [Mycobacterium sherrisii]ORW77323.1 hypothetical protein AWC25_10060 [Mycobacterium sherrisii]
MRARRNRSVMKALRRSDPAPDADPLGDTGRPRASTRALARIIERSARVQGPVAEAYVARLRRAYPGASPAEIVTKLEKRYLAALTASGAAVGSAATFPGIGTVTAMSAGAGETVFFLEATAVFVLANAVVYGVPADHRERRRALVLSVLVGDDSRRALGELIGPGRTNGGWLAEGMASLPLSTLGRVNTQLLKYFVKRYAVRRGALMFGKMLPVGIGAAIGGAGNRIIGKKIVRNARHAFGAPPSRWPNTLLVLPSVHEPGR